MGERIGRRIEIKREKIIKEGGKVMNETKIEKKETRREEVIKRIKERGKKKKKEQKDYIREIQQQEGISKKEAREKVLGKSEEEALRVKNERERKIMKTIEILLPGTEEQIPTKWLENRELLRNKLLEEAKRTEIESIKNKIIEEIIKEGESKEEIEGFGRKLLKKESEKEWEKREEFAKRAEAREKIEKATEK